MAQTSKALRFDVVYWGMESVCVSLELIIALFFEMNMG
jgi:hypothetical protein